MRRETYPDAANAPVRYCAPRVEDGEIMQKVRDRIAARFYRRCMAVAG